MRQRFNQKGAALDPSKALFDTRVQNWGSRNVSGIAIATGIAGFASVLHTLPGLAFFSPLMIAILLGILIRNTLGVHRYFQAGIQFSLKRLLEKTN